MVTIMITKENITIKTAGIEIVYPAAIQFSDKMEGLMLMEHKVVVNESVCRIEKTTFPKLSLRKEYSYPYIVGIQNVEIIDKTA